MMGKVAPGSLRFIPFQISKELENISFPIFTSGNSDWPILSYMVIPVAM